MVKNFVPETQRRQTATPGPHAPQSAFVATHLAAARTVAVQTVDSNGNARPNPAILAQELRALQRRSESVLEHELIRNPAAGALRNLGQSLLTHIRQIQEIRVSAARDSGPSDPWTTAIETRVQICHQLLDTIVAQIMLCDATARQSSIVAESARRLVAQERLAYQDLLPLFRRVFDEVQPASMLSRCTPVSGLPLALLVESQTGSADAAIFVEGLTAARLLVWALHDQVRESRRLPQLVLAALMADVGRLLATSNASAGQRFRAKRTEWLERHHPSIGAAVLGTIRGAPVGLALLVGQHHERLDGGGFPRGLMPRDLFPDASILAAATRFAHICLAPDAEQNGEAVGENAAMRAAKVLLSEAEWGMWPVDFARHIFHRLALTETEPPATVPVEAVTLPARTDESGEIPPVESFSGDRHWHLHDEEQGPPATHGEMGRLLSSSLMGEVRL